MIITYSAIMAAAIYFEQLGNSLGEGLNFLYYCDVLTHER